MSEQNTNISEFLAENFGANANYVEGLLARYNADPNSVDESWRQFFGDMLAGDGQPPAASPTPAADSVAPAAPAPVKSQPTAAVGPDTEAKPIIGPSKKIVENMEQSLTVPTATSLRTIPVKVLE